MLVSLPAGVDLNDAEDAAAIDYLASKKLISSASDRQTALRLILWNSLSSGQYVHTPMPVLDINGKPTGKFTQIESFGDYFDAVVGDMSGTYRRTLFQNLSWTLPAVARGNAIKPDGEIPNPLDIITLPESHWQWLASQGYKYAAAANAGDHDAILKLGEAIHKAQTLPKRLLRDKPPATETEPTIDGFETMILGGPALVIVPQDDEDIELIKAILKMVKWEVRDINSIVEGKEKVQLDLMPVTEDEDDGADLYNSYLDDIRLAAGRLGDHQKATYR